MAITSTVSVKSSRDFNRATRNSSHGTKRAPTKAITAPSAASFSTAMPGRRPDASPAGAALGASAGRMTSTSTVMMSSTTSQPTATRPSAGFDEPVVHEHAQQHDRARDGNRDAEDGAADHAPAERHREPRAQTVASALWPSAPGIAIDRTFSKSSRWKCRPTPNISRITPISASCLASARSADKSRRVRADDEARNQVAHDGGEPDAFGQQPEYQRRRQPKRDRRDEVDVVHAPVLSPAHGPGASGSGGNAEKIRAGKMASEIRGPPGARRTTRGGRAPRVRGDAEFRRSWGVAGTRRGAKKKASAKRLLPEPPKRRQQD